VYFVYRHVIKGMLATCVVQPIDLLKNRMQLQGEGGGVKAHKSSLHAAIAIARQEGFFGMYNGFVFSPFAAPDRLQRPVEARSLASAKDPSPTASLPEPGHFLSLLLVTHRNYHLLLTFLE
jgi:hypothetical protein